MIKAAIYDKTTGKIRMTTSCPPSHVSMQCMEGEEFYLNCPFDATHIINNEPVTIAPPPPTVEELLTVIRTERNRRLTATDWTQLPDAPVNKEAWQTYRQALRDLPATCDPNNPVWPATP